MAKVVVVNHLTLDGVMQAPGRPDEDPRGGFQQGGWASRRSDPEMDRLLGERMAGDWALLLGRRTYEDFAGFWPRQTNNPFTPVLNERTKYVVSTTLQEPLPWENSTLVRDVAEMLAAYEGPDLTVLGSGDLVQTLMRHDLIDEYLLMMHPLVIGSGRRLFPDGGVPAGLRLAGATTTGTGVIVANYAREDAR
jgi:dihydrofolate reductase